MSRAALLGLALLGAGCARTDHYRLVVEGFTPDQQEQVFAAAEQWTAAVPVSFDKQVGGCPEPAWNTICVREAYIADDGSGSPAWGRTTRRDELDYSASVEIAPGADPAYFQRVVLHELGHAQGLHHHGLGSAMYYDSYLQAVAPTQDDVDQWWSLRQGP